MLKIREACPDCGALMGKMHNPGCDVERCSSCKGQRLMCTGLGSNCVDHDPDLTRWTGHWPGTCEAADMGWFVYWGPPWITCTADYPEARPDLNRWAEYQITGKDPGPTK